MLQNYEIDHNGVIYQKEKTPIKYDESYVITRYDSYGELSNYMAHLRLGYILGAISSMPKSILDVGYGNGAFLKVCTNLIDDCYGNDVSGYQLPDKCTFIQDITSRHFDVITFFDSLEHFESIDFVRELKCNYVCISVPWCHYHSDSWFSLWKHRRENEHIFHFNKESLESFMREMGFELITYSNVEDTIRKSTTQDKNILTAVFRHWSSK